MCHINIYIFFLQSDGASWWRVWYQRGLPRLVFEGNPKAENGGGEPPRYCNHGFEGGKSKDSIYTENKSSCAEFCNKFYKSVETELIHQL